MNENENNIYHYSDSSELPRDDYQKTPSYAYHSYTPEEPPRKKRTGLKVIQNAFQPGDDCVRILCGDNAPGREHGCMSHAPFDILGIHTAVKPDGGVEIIGKLISAAGSSSCPEFSHNYLFFSSTRA